MELFQHTVVATRGDEARKAFFDNKSLSLQEGYKILMGAVRIPKLFGSLPGVHILT